jgi:hypothetical protein
MENLLYRKSPHENPEKGPAFPVRRVLAVFEKLMHKNVIREIDESCHPTTSFSALTAWFIDLPRETSAGRPECLGGMTFSKG